MSEADAGLPLERTRLAWQRTTLTGVAALLVAVRLLVEVSPLLGLLSGVSAALALVAPVWSAARWHLTNRSLASPQTDGRAPLVLAVLILSAGGTALGYVLLS